MLHPLQLQEISEQYQSEVVEIRDFLVTMGLSVETPDALRNAASRLRTDSAFHSDLALHMLAVFHASQRKISLLDALGILALATSGPLFAAQSNDEDTHEFMRFVMSQEAAVVVPEAMLVPVEEVPAVEISPEPIVAPESAAASKDGAVNTVRVVQDGNDWSVEPSADLEDGELLNPPVKSNEDRTPMLYLSGALTVFVVLSSACGFWFFGRKPGGNVATAEIPSAPMTPRVPVVAADRGVRPNIEGASEPVLDPFHVMSSPAKPPHGVPGETHPYAAHEGEIETSSRRALPSVKVAADSETVTATSRGDGTNTSRSATTRRTSRGYVRARPALRPVSGTDEMNSHAPQDTVLVASSDDAVDDDSASVAPGVEDSPTNTHRKTLGGIAQSLWHGLRHGIGKVL